MGIELLTISAKDFFDINRDEAPKLYDLKGAQYIHQKRVEEYKLNKEDKKAQKKFKKLLPKGTIAVVGLKKEIIINKDNHVTDNYNTTINYYGTAIVTKKDST